MFNYSTGNIANASLLNSKKRRAKARRVLNQCLPNNYLRPGRYFFKR